MTTPYDPYQAATSQLPVSTQSQIPGQIVGINNTTINTSEMNVSSIGGGVVLGYSGVAGAGNLYFSVAPSGGTDNFGNTYPTGISAQSGQLQGTSLIGVQMDSTSTLTGTNLAQTQILNPTVNGGTAAQLVHTMTNSNGSLLGYTYGSSTSTFATNGVYSWTAPTGITSIRVQCWGAGAGGGGGGGAYNQGGEGGGAGEYAEEPSFAVTPGQVYTIQVGRGGAGGVTGFAGSSGGATQFQLAGGSGLAVVANGGNAGANFIGGAGASGSTNTIHFNGGTGADASGNTGGDGGGSSAGPTSQGNNGTQSSGSSGASGGAAVSGGGAGGAGGNNASNGVSGSAPGGAGGGAGENTVVSLQKTYQPNQGTYSYYGDDATNGQPDGLRNHDGAMYQGMYSGGQVLGHQYSYMTLPYSTIQADLKGASVSSVTMHIRCLHAWYNSGMYCNWRYSDNTFFGSVGDNGAGATDVLNFHVAVNQTANANGGLNGGIGVALQNGNASSMLFGPTNTSQGLNYYGYFDSGANGGIIPAIVVSYTASGGASSAGNGADGQVIITYGSGSSPVYQLSVSAVQAQDAFGNTIQQGFQAPQVTVVGNQAPSTAPTGNTVASSSVINANTAGTVIATNTAGFTGQMPTNQVDVSTLTQTGTVTTTNITKAYNIPANDAQLGTTYRITAWGDVHIGATAEVTGFQIGWNGVGISNFQIGAAPQTVNTFYEWGLTGIVQVVASGATGTINSTLWGSYGIFVNTSNLGPGGGSFTRTDIALAGGQSSIATALNAAKTISVQAYYGTSASGNTIRCFGSTLERLGP